MLEEIKKEYTVKKVQPEGGGITTLTLHLENEPLSEFVPGQYITVYFPELGTPEGKAYSLSGAPFEGDYAISVKAIGEFSHMLTSLTPGNRVRASLPYGYFYSESTDTPLVLIAAGIGVAPFRSIVTQHSLQNSNRTMALFQSARTLDELVFKNQFDELAKTNSHFVPTYFVTREDVRAPGMYHERMTAEKILSTIGDLPGAEYMICGSISFTRDIWRQLREKGISEEVIYTEAFFSH